MAVLLLKEAIEDTDAVLIAQLLTQNTRLEMLDLTGNMLGSASVRALADALQANRTLTELRLTPNPSEPAEDARERIRVATRRNMGAQHVAAHEERQAWLEARLDASGGFETREAAHLEAAKRAEAGDFRSGDRMIHGAQLLKLPPSVGDV